MGAPSCREGDNFKMDYGDTAQLFHYTGREAAKLHTLNKGLCGHRHLNKT